VAPSPVSVNPVPASDITVETPPLVVAGAGLAAISSPPILSEPPSVPRAPASPKKNWLPIIIIVLVVGVVISGGLYFWSKWQQANTVAELSPTPAPKAANAANGSSIATVTSETTASANVLTPETPGLASVFGKVCPFGKQFIAGSVIFFDAKTGVSVQTQMKAGEGVYNIKMMPGSYVAIFKPTDRTFPNFAYSEYVRCGLKPNTCQQHGLLELKIEKNKEYGQVDLCDPQYTQAGLPTELRYENK
jgi:hypothetical protein